MKNKTQKAGVITLLLLTLLSACNLPTNTPPGLSIEEQAGTLAAQTIAAEQNKRPTKTPIPANTPTQPPSPTVAVTATPATKLCERLLL